MAESWAQSDSVRRTMLGNRRRDTGPELELRSILHARGLRFRVDARPLPSVNRRADILFRPSLVAVYVHGCFWHGCSDHYVKPKTNGDFWTTKVQRNVARDAETIDLLTSCGWEPIVVWEHEQLDHAADLIVEVVRARRPVDLRRGSRSLSPNKPCRN